MSAVYPSAAGRPMVPVATSEGRVEAVANDLLQRGESMQVFQKNASFALKSLASMSGKSVDTLAALLTVTRAPIGNLGEIYIEISRALAQYAAALRPFKADVDCVIKGVETLVDEVKAIQRAKKVVTLSLDKLSGGDELFEAVTYAAPKRVNATVGSAEPGKMQLLNGLEVQNVQAQSGLVAIVDLRERDNELDLYNQNCDAKIKELQQEYDTLVDRWYFEVKAPLTAALSRARSSLQDTGWEKTYQRLDIADGVAMGVSLKNEAKALRVAAFVAKKNPAGVVVDLAAFATPYVTGGSRWLMRKTGAVESAPEEMSEDLKKFVETVYLGIADRADGRNPDLRDEQKKLRSIYRGRQLEIVNEQIALGRRLSGMDVGDCLDRWRTEIRSPRPHEPGPTR